VRLGVSHRFTLVSVELARRRFQEGASSLKAEAVAGGDYFYESSSLALARSGGVPPFVATIASVLSATIPYEIVKFGEATTKISDENEVSEDSL
jgi:hypothetical protein